MPLVLSDSSTSEKHRRDDTNDKEVQKLLLLHRRFEKNAMRLFRNGLTEENRKEERNSVRRHSPVLTPRPGFTNLYELNNSPRKTHAGNFSKTFDLNREYSEQLLLARRDSNGEYISPSLGFAKDVNINKNIRRENTLRLPKLEGISPENKTIFYTTLPKMPPFPKMKERERKSQRKKEKQSCHMHINETNAVLRNDTCLTIRKLPSDPLLHRDVSQNGGGSSSTPLFQSAIDPIKDESTGFSSEVLSSNEGRLWLVPVVNIEIPSYRLGKPTNLDTRKCLTEDETERKMKRAARKETPQESKPAYKRNVHFSEFLHEIHLYSPLSTLSSKSK